MGEAYVLSHTQAARACDPEKPYHNLLVTGRPIYLSPPQDNMKGPRCVKNLVADIYLALSEDLTVRDRSSDVMQDSQWTGERASELTDSVFLGVLM